MSSREILFSNPSEEKEKLSASGRPLSLHRKAMEHTISGSLKRLSDPSPVKSQTLGSSMSVDAALCGDIPEPPLSVLVPESLDPTNVSLPDVSASKTMSDTIPESGKLDVNKSHNTLSERRSPRLNGQRQHRAVKKFRPPDNLNTLTPEMRGGIRGRRHHCDHQSDPRSQGSSPGNGSHLASLPLSGEEEGRNPGKEEEKNAWIKKDEEESKPGESR